ncbi:alanine racemase [Halomonas stenophila]|uniref:Diaminopimelate decarboxylase n=1 Tax=Halomonas stenophila TaxID=795312 RepID=A0A7W5ESL7_9GAMM|nr:alanine racemase [Halomonas stenophila]MBB3229595.1 diaminopimelate decarboxylase [Halomonas stenophila]
MRLDHAWLARLSARLGGSFYVFDEEVFADNYRRLRDGLRREWPRSEVAYAMKANYMPPIGRWLSRHEGLAEVVSRFEYEVARQHLPGRQLIFNGPIKRTADLRRALRDGSQVNLDSFEEVRRLARLAGEFTRVRIGLRLNFPDPELESRFGFEVESGELERVLAALAAIGNVELVSLHCHATCRARGVRDPVERLRRLCELAGELMAEHPLETLNIGGGLLGRMPESLKAQFPFPVPELDEYAAEIGAAMARYAPSPSLRLVVEPGVSMIADTMVLVAPVMEVRRRRRGWQALLDTNVNGINPTRSDTCPSLRAVTPRRHEAESLRRYRLVGNTCMEHDVICEAFEASRLEAGDFIVAANRGAYSLNYTPPFIVPVPALVDRHGRVLKAADDHHALLAGYRQPAADLTEG